MRPNIITGLDIGDSSLKILVAQKKAQELELEVLAQAEEISSGGVRRGVVINPDKVSQKISLLLSRVKNNTSQKIDSVFVNIGGGHIFVTPSHGVVAVSRADQKISQEDVDRVLQAAQTFSLPLNKEIIDIFPKEFIVDGEKEIKEALAIQGVRLEVEVLAICAFSPYIRNLEEAVLNSGLQIEDLILSPLASARAVLTPRQKELGVAVLDIGAGTSGLVVFEEGNLIHAAIFPIGSGHITNDIAIGLQIDIDLAERIKREFGSCLLRGMTKKRKGGSSAYHRIEIPNEEAPLVFSQKKLGEIIEARVLEIFDQVNKELKKISRQSLLPAGIVLTGGGAKLPKIVDLAKKELKLPSRIGMVTKGFIGLEEDPSLATLCGLVLEGADLAAEKSFSFAEGITAKLKKIFKIFIP